MSRYIDADILISYIREVGLLDDGYSHDKREDDVCNMIEHIKTADVQERKHGHWIEINSEMGIYRCSQCRETVGGQTRSRFCPNCGAKMFRRYRRRKDSNHYEKVIYILPHER